jgi:pimeloyl-ACP methyl ester carboxylesterase
MIAQWQSIMTIMKLDIVSKSKVFAVVAAFVSLALPSLRSAAAEPIRNVVIVHGAFADGSSWDKVIPLLQAKGMRVIAVQNPLTGLADDVAATKRAIDSVQGPIVLVGHSWGGAVISQVGNDPKVAALVFVAAGAPDRGQTFAEMQKPFPAPAVATEIREGPTGFLSLTAAGVNNDLAPDLPIGERHVLAATQGDWAAKSLNEKLTTAAWRTKPSWFVVAGNDRMINPDLERALAKKMRAHTTILNSSHVAMLAHPAAVAAVILDAAARAGGP